MQTIQLSGVAQTVVIVALIILALMFFGAAVLIFRVVRTAWRIVRFVGRSLAGVFAALVGREF